LIIRPATVADVPALYRLMQGMQTLHAGAHPEVFKATLDSEPTTAFFTEVLSNDRNIVLVAETSDAIIGYLWCQERLPADSFYARTAHTAYINHLSVDPSHRRRGIGEALVERVMAELKERDVVRVGVDYWTFNRPARSFFASLGFTSRREVCSLNL
jgi:ribosomal protein S18 acetylase RimI-like enzyme